jgi:ParB/RepB/Spo0J family partition protein
VSNTETAPHAQSESNAPNNNASARLRLIDVSCITVPPSRMRRLRPDVVDELAESISTRGLLHPIVVQAKGDDLILLAGAHRVAAVKKLGHHNIHARILDDLNADEALLAEIDENLIRADLSAAERALHLAERKRLYEKAHPETKKGASGRGRQKSQIATSDKPAPAFIDDAAKKTGKHRATIAREVARGKIPNIADAIGTSLDSAEELDKLAKLPEPVQGELIKRAKAGEKVTARHVAQKLARDQREQKLAAATEKASRQLGEKHYAVIYADPCWSFKVYNADSGLDHAADAHYPCMETAESPRCRCPRRIMPFCFFGAQPRTSLKRCP